MRLPVIMLVATCLVAPAAHAQDSTLTPPWSLEASLWAYIVPDNPDYLSPTVLADHDRLHLEGRYNYEALQTASFWVGYNVSAGRKLTMDLTLMAGGLVGDIDGAAPGYELTLAWWKLEFFSSGEYVFDFDDSTGNFFYNWSQLGISPADWLQLGIAIQRTQAYQTGRDIQRGFFAGATAGRFNFSTYVFNPDDTPTWILALAWTY